MPKINNIHYCSKCGHKMIWEYGIRLRIFPVDIYSIREDTYRPRLLNYNGGIAKLQFTCEKCKQVDIVNYDIYTSCTR